MKRASHLHPSSPCLKLTGDRHCALKIMITTIINRGGVRMRWVNLVCTAAGLTYRVEIMHYVSPKTIRKCTSSRISHLRIRVFRFCPTLKDIAIYRYSISIQILWFIDKKCFRWFRDSRLLKQNRECIKFRIIFEFFGARDECMTGRWNEPTFKPMWAEEWFACA